jgi:ATP-dependent DNA helicase RecG
MSCELPLNLEDLLRQRTVEGDRIEYKAGWIPDPVVRTESSIDFRQRTLDS